MIAWAVGDWRADPAILVPLVLVCVAYALGEHAYRRRRCKSWSRMRSAWFALGVASAIVAIESPLDAAGDERFAPHMLQHLIVTDVTAPLLLLGAPLLLALGALPTGAARRLVNALRSPVAVVLAHPVLTWSLFFSVLWGVHFSSLFEWALDDETVHAFEHVLFLSTALLFWIPVIPPGPAPWSTGALAYPLRMLYLFLAMPAEGLLGFAIFSAQRPLYAHYRGAGAHDQQIAGELMWIGGGFVMFVAFMIAGIEWARTERRRDAREVERERRLNAGGADERRATSFP